MYGTAEISQVLFAWILARLSRPAARARDHFRAARGPGPGTEIEYSPTLDSTPPRRTGASHSLTLRSRASLGSSGIRFSARLSPQPQSQMIRFAVGLCRRIPARNVPI